MAVGLDVFAALEAVETESGHPMTGSSRHSASGVPTPLPETDPSAVGGSHQEMFSATGTGPEDLLRAISAWARLHGLVSLELGGNFSSMGIDADALFRHEVDALVREHGRAGDPS